MTDSGGTAAHAGVPETGIRVRSRETVRTGRYALIGAEPAQAKRLWIVLHGYGQLAPRFLRAFEGIVPADTCVVAPEGLSRFYREMPKADGSHLQHVGANWMTREERDADIADAIHWLDVVYDEVYDEVTRPWGDQGQRLVTGVLGFSQGVAMATRWVARGRASPAHFVAWAGSVASDVQEEVLRERLAQAAVTLVTGSADALVSDLARRDVMATLGRVHAAPREISFAGGHHLDPGVLTMLMDELSPHA